MMPCCDARQTCSCETFLGDPGYTTVSLATSFARDCQPNRAHREVDRFVGESAEPLKMLHRDRVHACFYRCRLCSVG